MSVQIRFYAIDSDLRALLQCATDLRMLGLPEVVETGAVDDGPVAPISTPAETAILHPGGFYLMSGSFAPVEVFYHPLRRNPSVSGVDARNSPIIQFIPSLRTGSQVSVGRLYLEQDSNDPRYAITRQAYSALAKYISQWPRAGTEFVGPSTLALARTGVIQLMLAPGRARNIEDLPDLPQLRVG
jgi:hypothetical protein